MVLLSSLVKITIEEANHIFDCYDEVIVMFSGGKDSLVAMHLSKEIKKDVKALFIDTGITTPGLKDYIISTTNKLDVELYIVTTTYNYFDLVLKKGFPSITRRWCKDYLKIKPLKCFIKNTFPNKDVLLVTGVRREESWMKSRAHKLFYNPRIKANSYAILFDWKREDIINYINLKRLGVNPLYEIYGKAYDCWCSVYKSPADFAKLRIYNPDFFEKFVKTESRLRKGGSGLFYAGERIYFRDILKNPQYYLSNFISHGGCPLCKLLLYSK